MNVLALLPWPPFHFQRAVALKRLVPLTHQATSDMGTTATTEDMGTDTVALLLVKVAASLTLRQGVFGGPLKAMVPATPHQRLVPTLMPLLQCSEETNAKA